MSLSFGVGGTLFVLYILLKLILIINRNLKSSQTGLLLVLFVTERNFCFVF